MSSCGASEAILVSNLEPRKWGIATSIPSSTIMIHHTGCSPASRLVILKVELLCPKLRRQWVDWIGQTSVHPSLPTMTMVTQLLVLSSSSEPESLRAIKVQAGPREPGILAYCRFEANYLPVPSSERRRFCADRLCSWAVVAKFSLSMMISPSLINCTLVLPITSTCVNLLSERANIDFTALRHNCFQVVPQKEEIPWLRSSDNCIWSHQVGE